MIFVKFVPTFFILLSCSGHAERLKPNSPEWLAKHAEFIEINNNPVIDSNNPPISKEHVTFHLFSNKNPDQYIQLTEENLHEVDAHTEKIFLIVHGWLEHRERPWYEDLKNAILGRYKDSSVIQVDYMEPAFDFYPNSVRAAKDVGEFIGDFIITVSQKLNISPKKFTIIGHSLGSHVSGLAGKTVKRTLPAVGRIIALDPAAPAWEGNPCERRLCESDADVVVGVHTDTRRYGYKKPIGTIDFYPNGGEKQKGCKTPQVFHKASDETMCDHWRSWAYMIEAIQNPNHFLSFRCDDWETFETNRNECDKVAVSLGDLDTTEKGTFYFPTNEDSPYAKESENIKFEL